MKNLLVILFATLSIFISLNSYAQELNPGDGIRISFLDIKEVITGDYYIQPNGLINLPQIGDNRTLATKILKRLNQK